MSASETCRPFRFTGFPLALVATVPVPFLAAGAGFFFDAAAVFGKSNPPNCK